MTPTLQSKITQALKYLEEAKRDLLISTGATDDGQQEKASLETSIQSLRQEKKELEESIKTLKRELAELDASCPAHRQEEIQQNETEEQPTNQGGDVRDDGILIQDDDSYVNCDGADDDIVLDNMDAVVEGQNDNQDTHAAAASSSSSSVSTTTTTTTSSSSKKKRHRVVHKANTYSPKKWRRMIRTHRLQSIILTN